MPNNTPETETPREELVKRIEMLEAALESAGDVFENMADIADDLRSELVAMRAAYNELDTWVAEMPEDGVDWDLWLDKRPRRDI